jgi:hypothetical protein
MVASAPEAIGRLADTLLARSFERMTLTERQEIYWAAALRSSSKTLRVIEPDRASPALTETRRHAPHASNLLVTRSPMRSGNARRGFKITLKLSVLPAPGAG